MYIPSEISEDFKLEQLFADDDHVHTCQTPSDTI